MRKLPPDSEVAALRACGMPVKDIAERYNVGTYAVYSALRRWDGRQSITADECRSAHPDGTFTRKSAQPVEHRDTGDNVGFLQPVSVYKVQRTSLRECGDLLREWGVGRGFA